MNFKRYISTLILACLWAIAGLGVVSAQSAASLNVTGAAFTRCSDSIIEGSFGVTALDSGGGIINSSTAISATVYAVSNSGGYASDSWSYVAGSSVAFAFSFPGSLSYADLFVQFDAARSDTYRFGCDGTITRFGGGGGADARLNYGHGDLISALYSASDADGHPTIRVYDIAPDSTGILRGDYAYELFEPYINNPPSVNTYLGKLGRTTLTVLTSGEFQINVGPDAEGKIHEVILKGIPPVSIKFSSYLQ